MAVNYNHFTLTLDTTSPTGSITANAYYKENGTVTISKGDAAKMKVWFNSKPIGTKSDSEYPSSWTTAADSYATAFTTEGSWYYHLVLRDDVGNESSVYNTDEIIFDKTAPIVNSVIINDGAAYTTSRTVTVVFTFSDASPSSGIADATISGNLKNSPISASLTAEEILNGTATRTVTFTDEAAEGTQTISVTATDNAGNVSAANSDTIFLDTIGLSGHLVIYNTDDTAAVPTYINYTGVTVRIDANKASDWAYYKVWLSTEEEPSWTVVSGKTGTDEHISISKTLPASDGEKIVKGKIKDSAGNETTLTNATVTLDLTAPVISAFSSDVAYISDKTGHTTATLTTTASDALSGVASWNIKSGETVIKSGTGAVPATVTVTNTDLVTEGAKSLKLAVVDVAGNSNVSAVVTVTVDLTAPVPGEVKIGATWLNATTYPNAGATASATDAGAGMVDGIMTCWVDTTAGNTTPSADAVTSTYAANPTHSQIGWNGHQESDSNYLHIKYVDAVGNYVFAHSAAFGIDTVLPTSTSITLPTTAASRSITATGISGTDTTSGLGKMKVWGDITDSSDVAIDTEAKASWVTYASSYSIKLSSGDGEKYVYVKFMDKAGNEQTASASKSNACELDTSAPTATIVLRTADDSKAQPLYVNVATLAARISGTDDGTTGVASQYKLYGDFTYDSQQAQGITEAAAEWKTLTYGTGLQYQLISNMYCTSGDGTKTIYLKVKDNAGNESAAANQAFTYDTTAPEVTVSGVDYNRISKVHETRDDNDEKYNDETNFTFTPNSVIQAYKVCAYADETAAKAGNPASDTPIPTTAGSSNMSATGLSSDAAVNALIKGADYESVLGGTGHDGAHIVVVYVQDLAGNWSEVAKFTI